MKIDSIYAKSHPPIGKLEVEGLSNIVVLAGPNGVGKTRLTNALLQALQNPGSQNVSLVISATSDEERKAWGSNTLDTRVQGQASHLTNLLQRSKKRGKWRSSVVYFDSARQFTSVVPMSWSWGFTDPIKEEIGWSFGFNPFQNRYQDTVHSIYRMLGHHRTEISKRAIELQRAGQKQMDLDFPDPLKRFKDAFHLLLAPKELAEIDVNNPQLIYLENGQRLGIENLSSGEKEVFSIVFDLLLREPEDCIIFFDEPELHLHPELSFRLLKTLQMIGLRNQFIFCTHSADIISGAIDHSVVFIAPRPKGENQGILLKPTDEYVSVLRELGQSLGVISLGRKIILIEGSEKSIDRDTYGAIAQGRFPSLVLAPSGSRQTILSFSKIVEEVLDRTMWGIEFFMIADRDNSLPDSVIGDLETRAKGRLRFLPRYHVENYFLDEENIAEAFAQLVPEGEWLRKPQEIALRLKNLAKDCIPLAVNLWLSMHVRSLAGEANISLKDVINKNQDELATALTFRLDEEKRRIESHLDSQTLVDLMRKRWTELQHAIDSEDDRWKYLFPGKMLVGQFCGLAKIDKGHFRNLYIAAARGRDLLPFKEIVDIFTIWAPETKN